MPDLIRTTEIVGCRLSAAGGLVALSNGHLYLPTGRRLRSDGTATAAVPANQAVGWLHAYAYQGANGLAALELSTAAPEIYRGNARRKTNDDTRRYLGSGRVEATGKLRGGQHQQALGDGNLVIFDVSNATFATPQRLLDLSIGILNAPAQQEINLASVVPPTATGVIVQVNNMSNLTCYVGRPSMGALSNIKRANVILPNNNLAFSMVLESDLKITLLASTTGLLGTGISLSAGNVAVEALGYYFDR